MSNAQHTPGPWSINAWPQRDTSIRIGTVGTPLIAEIPPRDVSINEQKANAHLIKAAPAMLTACELALALIKDTWIAEHGNKHVGETWGALESAIQLAKGEA